MGFILGVVAVVAGLGPWMAEVVGDMITTIRGALHDDPPHDG